MTTRYSQGFDSTAQIVSKSTPPSPKTLPTKVQGFPPSAAAAKMTAPETTVTPPSNIPSTTRQYLEDSASPIIHNILTDADPPFQVSLSMDPIDNTVIIDVPTTGNDPLLGFSLVKNKKADWVQFKHCVPGTPAMRIPKWRSTLRNSYITSANGVPLISIEELKAIVQTARILGSLTIAIGFATVDCQAMYPVLGVPQIHHD